MIGGFLLGWLTKNGGLDLPVLGHLKPWQAMFVLVGLPGLIPAILFVLTVREPKRREVANKATPRASGADIRAFIAANRMTLFCHHAGIALILMSIYAYLNWMPTYFLRVHGWEPPRFSTTYGLYSIAAGIFSALASGWFATWLKDRGYTDGTLRACMIGSAGSVIGCTLSPLMPTPEAALVGYILTGCFVNAPSVLGLASIAEMVPNEMRGIITASYIVMIGLLAAGLGPFGVGLVTDFVFADKAAVGSSLVVISLVTGVSGLVLLATGLKAYRATLSRATWAVTRT